MLKGALIRLRTGASGEQLLNKVEQWLDTAEAPTDAGPPVAEPLSPTAVNTTRRRQAGADFSAGAPALAVRRDLAGYALL